MRDRACDPCASRKIKCDRRSPCQRCKRLGLNCATSRALLKPGPKGPWAEKRRQLQSQKTCHNLRSPESISSNPEDLAESPHKRIVSNTSLQYYLDIYHQKLFPIWPVVDRNAITQRLRDLNDLEAYTLATALSAVVIVQLQLTPSKFDKAPSGEAESERIAEECENLRRKLQYPKNPTIDLVLSSFFLHVFNANRGHLCKSTVLLREAITVAQFLGLDHGKHYATLSKAQVQSHLRIIWLLFITERGHTTRFELSRLLTLSSDLPPLEAAENPSSLLPFVSMCQLFQIFGNAMDSSQPDRTIHFFASMDANLREMCQTLSSNRDLQRADFLITQQWMRMVLWKMAMFHIELSADAADESLSVFFPEMIARNVMVYLSEFPQRIIEAHGLGMQMKLADVAISLVDTLTCSPWMPESCQLMRVGSREIVCNLQDFLTSIRGNVNPRLEMLQEKMSKYIYRGSPKYPLLVYEDSSDSSAEEMFRE